MIAWMSRPSRSDRSRANLGGLPSQVPHKALRSLCTARLLDPNAAEQNPQLGVDLDVLRAGREGICRGGVPQGDPGGVGARSRSTRCWRLGSVAWSNRVLRRAGPISARPRCVLTRRRLSDHQLHNSCTVDSTKGDADGRAFGAALAAVVGFMVGFTIGYRHGFSRRHRFADASTSRRFHRLF
jgi:hypothetical protein